MINISELRRKVDSLTIDDLKKEVINLSYFISNCEDTLGGRKVFGNTVNASDLICSSVALGLMTGLKKIEAEKKEKRLKILNEVLKHEQK